IQQAAVAPPPVETAPPPAPAPVVATPLPETAPAPPLAAAPSSTAPPPTAPIVAAPMPAPAPQPPMNVQADIATASSGSVPFSAIKSPPFGGQMEVAVIQFGFSSSGLGGNDLAVLSRVAQIQKRNGGTIRVVAHAAKDASGTSFAAIERGNYEVSRRRALAIANHLMQLGVPRSAIVAEAASDGEPRYDTNTARGTAANRRAEVYLDL
ncbi:MAG: OmpA family protein, partial [Reyranellales bacterium]